jgi:hypothetical protein
MIPYQAHQLTCVFNMCKHMSVLLRAALMWVRFGAGSVRVDFYVGLVSNQDCAMLHWSEYWIHFIHFKEVIWFMRSVSKSVLVFGCRKCSFVFWVKWMKWIQ